MLYLSSFELYKFLLGAPDKMEEAKSKQYSA